MITIGKRVVLGFLMVCVVNLAARAHMSESSVAPKSRTAPNCDAFLSAILRF